MKSTMTIQESKDNEDAKKAIDFYVGARIERRMLPLEIILGLWPTPNWSDRSKELFLQALSKGLECDRGRRSNTVYTRYIIETYFRTRSRGLGSSTREYDEI